MEARNTNNVDNTAVPDNITEIQNKLARPCPPVVIGNQGRRAEDVQQVEDYSTLQVGVMVAVFCPEYNELPQIGKVVDVTDDQFKIHWHCGKWNTAWIPHFQRIGRKKTPWEDWQPKESALLWDFHLTARKMLKKTTVEELKIRYRTLKIENS
ncbi:nipped-B-like protein B [Saccoglossus kowalevskii]